jgi:DNA-binding NtrC family response regulator
MAEEASQQPEPGQTPSKRRTRSLRWHGLFQRCHEAVFLLDRRRKLLFVNRAWETLTGFSLDQVRGLICQHRLPKVEPRALQELARTLRPPLEVLRGKTQRVRRWLSHPRQGAYCCDIQFLPLAGAQTPLAILGKLLPVRVAVPSAGAALSTSLMSLREHFAQHFTTELWNSRVPAMQRVRDQVRLASLHPCPVLIRGEPGAGKRWLARVLHHQGPAREQTFVALDCRRLPPRALAAAHFDETGLPRRKDRGTLYLSEPSHLPRELQARLWEAYLSEMPAEGSVEVRPAGLSGPRILVGCTTDPLQEVQAGRLLESFHCALSTLTIELPPLRQRLDDLPLLVGRCLDRACQNTRRRVSGLSDEAWQFLRTYNWPENLRELFLVLFSACVRCQGERIESGDLPWYVRASTEAENMSRPLPTLDEILSEVESRIGKLRGEVEKRLITQALRSSKGNKTAAAKELSISRPRLLRRMKELGVSDIEDHSEDKDSEIGSPSDRERNS